MSDISDELRRQVVARAGDRCEYCLVPTIGQVATFPVDHIEPRSSGGATVLENLALACPSCNGHKWAHATGTDDASASEVELFNPRRQKWSDHFRWSAKDPLAIEGITPTGRATVSRLQMNAANMLVVRRLLKQLGFTLGSSD